MSICRVFRNVGGVLYKRAHEIKLNHHALNAEQTTSSNPPKGKLREKAAKFFRPFESKNASAGAILSAKDQSLPGEIFKDGTNVKLAWQNVFLPSIYARLEYFPFVLTMRNDTDNSIFSRCLSEALDRAFNDKSLRKKLPGKNVFFSKKIEKQLLEYVKLPREEGRNEAIGKPIFGDSNVSPEKRAALLDRSLCELWVVSKSAIESGLKINGISDDKIDEEIKKYARAFFVITMLYHLITHLESTDINIDEIVLDVANWAKSSEDFSTFYKTVGENKSVDITKVKNKAAARIKEWKTAHPEGPEGIKLEMKTHKLAIAPDLYLRD